MDLGQLIYPELLLELQLMGKVGAEVIQDEEEATQVMADLVVVLEQMIAEMLLLEQVGLDLLLEMQVEQGDRLTEEAEVEAEP